MPIVLGTSGNDLLWGSPLDDEIHGDAGNDDIHALGGADAVWGDDGDDIITGDEDADSLHGGAGNDTVNGSSENDTLWGDDGDDVLDGDVHADKLYGGAGQDSLFGGEGHDRLTGDAGDDRLDGGAGNDVFDGGAGIDTVSWRAATSGITVVLANSGGATARNAAGTEIDSLLRVENLDGSDHVDQLGGNNLANLLRGFDGADRLSGFAGGDRLEGGVGDDVLEGGAGSDLIEGGDGEDLAVFDGRRQDYGYSLVGGVLTLVDRRAATAGDADALTSVEFIQFADSGPIDLADAGATPVAAANDLLIVTAGVASSLDTQTLLLNDDVNATSYVAAVTNVVGATVSLVDGRLVIVATGGGPASFDYQIGGLNGGASAHVVIQTASLSNAGDTYVVPPADGVDIHGLNGADILTGSQGWDRLVGGAGADTLDGAAGSDTLVGGLGHDVYVVDEARDRIVELAGEGEDIVDAMVDYTLGDGVERLHLFGAARRGVGNGLDNRIYGAAGDDWLDGGAGADLLYGGAGDDTFVIDDVGDRLNDTGGVDTVRTTLASYTLTAVLENLIYAGAGNFTGIGSARVNHLVGGAGDDWLDSGGGADTLEGGAGSDTYVINNAAAVIVEAFGVSGLNTLHTSVSYTLPDTVNLQVVRAIGTANVNLTGSSLRQSLYGNDAANILDGGGGGDEMFGGLGDDTYNIRATGDRTNELASGGYDTVRVWLGGYVANGEVEKIVMMTGVASVTGSASDNLIIGNALDNSISGGPGADRMEGGAGFDTYHVDNPGDVIVDSSGGGYVYSRASSFTLGAGLSGGTLLASGDLTGNELNNQLRGTQGEDYLAGGAGDDSLYGDVEEYNPFSPPSSDTLVGGDGNDALYGMDNGDGLSGGAGNDHLDGGVGADGMSGGPGDDSFTVDDEGDGVYEAAGEGHDTIWITEWMFQVQTYTMPANVEDMFYGGFSDFTGTGNGSDNVIYGWYGNDTLRGMGGDDVLICTWGTDTMEGGAGADTFRYESADQSTVGSARDVILDFEAGDIIDLAAIDADVTTAGLQDFILHRHGRLHQRRRPAAIHDRRLRDACAVRRQRRRDGRLRAAAGRRLRRDRRRLHDLGAPAATPRAAKAGLNPAALRVNTLNVGEYVP